MQEITSIANADIAGKRVLVRVDFNVPLDHTGAHPRIVDSARIQAAIPTITFLHEKGAAKIILMTHLGRPEGKVDEALRTAPLGEALRTFIDYPEVELLENVRFDPREETNDPDFAKELAAHGDIYVNEAFSVSHRADASVVGVPALLPSFGGLRFIEEVARLTAALTPPEHSLAIIGGAKFETKEPLLEKLTHIYGELLLGGALANDLLKSRGMPIGASTVSDLQVPTSLAQNTAIHEPVDLVVTSEDGGSRMVPTGDVRQDEKIVDIGDKTVALWSEKIRHAPFVLWNGPTGVYEKGFTIPTDTLASALVNAECQAVIGGGDTRAALSKFVFDPSRIFVSTGGGAMLQFLADGTLPGIEALKH